MDKTPSTATSRTNTLRASLAHASRQVYILAVAGALGAVFGLYLDVELFDIDYSSRTLILRDMLAGVTLGGAIGFFLNAADPLRDGAWLRMARAATWGAIAGAAGGALGLLLGEFVMGGFRGGRFGRATAWAILGLGIGVSQGLAYRSKQRLIFGVTGGAIGGFLGGFLFESLRDALGNRYDLSQGLGVAILGAGLGLCLALVERALRKAWVEVMRGRQEGRAYLLDKRHSILGLDEHIEVGLFGDPNVARKHAEIEATGAGYVLHNHDAKGRTKVNGKPIQVPEPLKDGDRIELGQTLLVFRQRGA